ncbi:hypothetical protein TrLO_g10849 [Triparma laevis f. longispina]|uniref:Deacetylase sirtuin-type domain-containing protein n=1 Tax=Triparma laevis f. longispina TaxID=1714387 RepID=A0A9W7FRI5_9STRA|nr:hypothetical protein TrLO_g10849 [Triparma laevis f. longispina]
MSSPSLSNPYLPLLHSSSTPIFLLGAGISTSLGIPDFRSSEGLYATLKLEEYGLNAAEDLFDYEHFCASPFGFFKWARNSLTLHTTGSKFHHFLATLKNLHRVYTQNIDGLEFIAGVPQNKIVECHGSLKNSTCLSCGHTSPTSSFTGSTPLCSVPAPPQIQGERKSSRYSNIEKLICGGILKPNITFFGEPLPPYVSKSIGKDRGKGDLVTVVGTSLKVEPFSKILRVFEGRKVLVNRDFVAFPGGGEWDWVFLCDSDVIGEEGGEWVEVVDRVFVGKGGIWDSEKYQKSLIKKETTTFVVETVTCDCCGGKTTKPFYTCVVCEGYDLCEQCVKVGEVKHKAEEGQQHVFRRIT